MSAEEHREMNLFDFIIACVQWIKKFFIGIGRLVLNMIRLSLQHIWITVSLVLVGALCGYLSTLPFATEYKGRATITYTEGMRQYVHNGVNLYFSMPKEFIIDTYGAPQEALNNLKRFNMYNVIDAKNDSTPDYIDYDNIILIDDTINVVMPDRLCLELKIRKNQDFNLFKSSLVKFLSSQPSIIEADKINREIATNALNRYNKEITRLDSLSDHEYFNKPYKTNLTTDRTILITEKEKELFYGHILQLTRRRDYVETRLKINKDIINFETDFIVTSMSPILKYIIGILSGYILSLLIILIVKYRVSIKEFLKQR